MTPSEPMTTWCTSGYWKEPDLEDWTKEGMSKMFNMARTCEDYKPEGWVDE